MERGEGGSSVGRLRGADKSWGAKLASILDSAPCRLLLGVRCLKFLGIWGCQVPANARCWSWQVQGQAPDAYFLHREAFRSRHTCSLHSLRLSWRFVYTGRETLEHSVEKLYSGALITRACIVLRSTTLYHTVVGNSWVLHGGTFCCIAGYCIVL